MEVHAHAHTSRKKWTHYFWEFLMLFLAVFCGFLAENQREHIVEHQREKQYMRSMVEDLMRDTAEINERLAFIDSLLLPPMKKSLNLIYLEDYRDSILNGIHNSVPRCARFFDVSFEDRTMIQLKSSGNFRLIGNKRVTDSLAAYWKLTYEITNTLFRGYELSRIEVKNLCYKLFNFKFYEGYNPYNVLRSDAVLKLNIEDRHQFIELGNFIANLHNQAAGPITLRLKEASKRATDVINLIREEYHLK
jgi:hypothetical protein